MNGSAIGIMDSGIGGLTVLSHIKALLPQERLIYLADNAFCPYGPRPAEEVTDRCRKIVRFFLRKECKMVVFACNTATAAAIHTLRAEFPDLPIVGMEPAVKPAVLHTRTGVVGVLATKGTLKGSLYNRTLATFAGEVKVIEKVGEGWVDAVERGEWNSPATREMVAATIKPLLDLGADHLVLGCTHYPFLAPVIGELAGPHVVIVDPAPAVAQRVKWLLLENNLTNNSGIVAEDEFYTTGEVSVLPRAVAKTANGGTIKWRSYTLENIE